MKLIALLLAAFLTVPFLGTIEAKALGLGRMLQDSGLSPNDLSVMETIALQLVNPLGSTGDARRWSNPESRSKGTVTLGRIEGDCAELVHSFNTVRRPGTAIYHSWRCRRADGTWQISVGPK
ncbi:hypothetical protein HAT86_15150 [Roseovarius gahaiensis]|uniref:Surface antigen domain-containing protein n=1 Tax=Roseovarius gahaiensis TaxID=2716691 RepID=A0A967BF43_9RHOB|nr:hypothetical protein [Roseovarius gahaiensis]NHQ75788.1 hypothetical protein [Roseovarius gahaiensis]